LNYFAVVALLTVFPTSAYAVGNCYPPIQPYCLTGISTFDDQFSFDRCRREMDTYRQEIVDHSQCLRDWIDSEVRDAQAQDNQAQEEYSNAIKYWNCKAKDPSDYCSRP